MKHNIKSIACLLAAVCTALPLLSACAGDPTPTEQPTDTAPVAQSDTLPADSTPTELSTEPETQAPAAKTPPPPTDRETLTKRRAMKLMSERSFTDGTCTLPYRIYVPDNYDEQYIYPLIVFLHGAGERGTDNRSQLQNGMDKLFRADDMMIYDSIVIAPQCPADGQWVDVPTWDSCIYSTDEIPESAPLKAVVALINELKGAYSIDNDRVYVTGLSMGGYASWDLLVRHGDMFAAAIPVCGGCDVSKAAMLTDIPIRTFHGTADSLVPPTGTETMVEAIRGLGGEKLIYTPFAGMNHDIWENAYATEGLIPWLLSQKLSDRK